MRGAALARLPVWLHLVLLGAAGVALWRIGARVDALYVASGHPASHFKGQTRFSAERMMQDFAAMSDAGLDLYRQSQMLDFGLIAAIAAVALLLGRLLARLGGPGSLGYRAGMTGAVLGLASAGMDVLENLTSLRMLTQPQQITQLAAVLYSSFAAAKFVFLGLAAVALVVALFVGIVERLAGAYRPR